MPSRQIKGKAPVFCGKCIAKNFSNYRFLRDGLWTVPIIRSKTPMYDMLTPPEGLPNGSKWSLDDAGYSKLHMLKGKF
jgi:hypothetical protein